MRFAHFVANVTYGQTTLQRRRYSLVQRPRYLCTRLHLPRFRQIRGDLCVSPAISPPAEEKGKSRQFRTARADTSVLATSVQTSIAYYLSFSQIVKVHQAFSIGKCEQYTVVVFYGVFEAARVERDILESN